MRRVDITYRITKIGKHAVSVAVCGLMTIGVSGLRAESFNVNTSPSVSLGGGNSVSFDIYFDTNGNNASNFKDLNNLTLTLQSGANLVGETPVGLDGQYAVYTRQVRDTGDGTSPYALDNVYFSDLGTVVGVAGTSTLNLQGNNSLTGIVGVHLQRVDDTNINDTYASGSVTADPLDLININGISGTSVTFNRQVFADRIEINNASAVSFLGNVGGTLNGPAQTTIIDFNGHNANVTFGAITLNGAIENTTTTAGDMSNGTLVLADDATITGGVGNATTGLKAIQVNRSGSTVSFGSSVTSNQLNYGAAANVRITGNLLMNVDAATPSEVIGVTFSGTNGTLEIINGNLTGLAGQAVVTNSVNNRGTLGFTGSSDGNSPSTEQTVTGHIGESGKSIATLNIGAGGNNHALVTVNGDIYATTIALRNDATGTLADSRLTLSADRNITGAITTDSAGQGDLTLAGGTQTVTGTVGAAAGGLRLDTVTSGNAAAASASVFTGDIYANTVTNLGGAATGPSAATTTYRGDVFAATVNVGNGLSTFEQGLTTFSGGATTTINIAGGTANLNTNSTPPATPFTKTTTGNIVFSGIGFANLHQGLTGTINFGGNNATVTLWNDKNVTGAITTSANNTGIFNSQGSGTLGGQVGAAGASILSLNVNTANLQTQTGNPLIAQGSIFANTVNLQNDGELSLVDGVNVTGNITTTSNNTGVLTLQDNNNPAGTNTITGNVGAPSAALRQINAGSTNEVDTFTNGVVHATTLAYRGNGTITFNGLNSKVNAVVTDGALTSGGGDLGFVGSVDFGVNNTGIFVLGNNVDLVTQHATSPAANTQTTFVNANSATLRFEGSSVVTGRLGSGEVSNGAVSSIGNDTFRRIEAGAAGGVVTFLGDVFVDSNTFNVVGNGVVNFIGDLNGPLIFDANGSVNLADGRNVNGTVTTSADGQGTLNFVGSAATRAPIGGSASALRLSAVNFHAATTDSTALPVTAQNETVTIGHNVFALTTTIGTNQNADSNATAATIAANVFLGNQLTLAAPVAPPTASNVTLNTAGTVTTATQAAVDAGSAVSRVNFVHTKNANGTLTNTATVTQSTTGTGAITTNGATLNFAIASNAWSDPVGPVQGAGGTLDNSPTQTVSSRITGGAGSTLVMSGAETVNLSLLGSLRNGQTYTLIDMAADGGPQLAGTLRDNSFVIDTSLSRGSVADVGDLIVTASRGVDVYITKSATGGHFSNPVALGLGTLGAAGQDYSQDMQTVFNILDIDQWGFGNNQANLAVQVQRLAPIANNSYVLSAFRAASLVGDSIGSRMHQLRIPEQAKPYEAKGLWARTVNQSDKAGAQGTYDGFKTTTSGAVVGLDAYPNRDSLVGVAIGYSTTKVKQQGFRQGDETTVEGAHLTFYGAYNITPEFYIGGQITNSWVSTDANRSTAIARVAKADFDSDQLSAKLDLGYRFQIPNRAIYVTPIASFETSTIDQDAYAETGSAGAIGLNVSGEKFRRNQAAVGLRIDGTTTAGGVVVKPELSVMATRDSGAFAKDVRASLIGDLSANPGFTTEVSDNIRKNGYKVSLGVGALLNKTTSMALRYEHARVGKSANMADDTLRSDALDLAIRWNF